MKKKLYIFIYFIIYIYSTNCYIHADTYSPQQMREILDKAKKGDPYFQCVLGLCYGRGDGVSQDYSEAVKWWKLAAEQNNVTAQYNLAILYENGLGTPQNDTEAFNWYLKAAENGYNEAFYWVATKYHDGRGTRQSYNEAAKWYRLAAENGNVKAMYAMGVFYQNGWGVSADYGEAYKYYKMAADYEVPDAMFRLGWIYANGWIAKPNFAEAVKWYKKAADQNVIGAMNNLGVIYYNGNGVPQDYVEAAKYYKMAADNGDINAQSNLAGMYLEGIGVNKDYAEAVKWYKKAAAQGNETAKLFLDHSEIDFDIPSNINGLSNTTFAVIIGNEEYNKVSKVPYAKQDSKIFKEYLNYAVGVPKDNIKSYTNAGYGDIAGALKYVENLSEAFGDELNLIFYYAGHGIPNERTSQAMLLPVDGDATIPETCFDLDQLYSKLGSLKANSVLVILDACFSGTERGDNMLVSARGLKIKAKQAEPTGNLIVLSASQGDETAYPLEKEKHGMFTYFLLKKLQENRGDVTLGELSDYVISKVKQQSIVANGKIQTPSITVSPSMKDNWRNMKFGK